MAKAMDDYKWKESTPGLQLGDRNSETREALVRLVVVQGVVTRFNDQKARDAFLSGHFMLPGIRATRALLLSIDAIRELVLPYPGYAEVPQIAVPDGSKSLLGVEFFIKLLQKSDETPKDKNGEEFPHKMSFCSWFDFLRDVSRSSVWRKLASEEPLGSVRPKRTEDSTCADLGTGQAAENLPSGLFNNSRNGPGHKSGGREDGEDRVSQRSWSSIGRCPPTNNLKEESGGFGKSKSSREYFRRSYHGSAGDSHDGYDKNFWDSRSSESRRSCYRGGNSRNRMMSENFSSSENESFNSSPPLRSQINPGVADLSRLLLALQQPKNFVPPSKFDGSDSTSLRTFFKEYESYFDGCYQGSDVQKSKKLAEFLDGPIRTAFDAMEGHKMGYPKVRQKLDAWYRTQRTNTRGQAETEFGRARMRTGDTLSIYALRLERIAEKAYPDEQENERQLVRKFRKTVPPYFRKALDYAERNLVLIGKDRRLRWKQIVSLAEAEDKKLKYKTSESSDDGHGSDAADIWFSRPEEPKRKPKSSPKYDSPQVIRKKVAFEPRESPNSPPARQYQRVPLPCSWCGRRGHSISGCWLRRGWCSSCGSPQHQRSSCPNAPYKAPDVTPACPNCCGEHWGKDCTEEPISSDNLNLKSLSLGAET